MTQEICCSKPTGYMLIKQLGLHESNWGYPQGAKRQYRDSQEANSTHAREFETRIYFHRDSYNPEHNLIGHFVYDVLKPEAVLAGILTSAIALASSKDWKKSLIWGLGVGTLVQLLIDNHQHDQQG